MKQKWPMLFSYGKRHLLRLPRKNNKLALLKSAGWHQKDLSGHAGAYYSSLFNAFFNSLKNSATLFALPDDGSFTAHPIETNFFRSSTCHIAAPLISG